MNSQQGKCNFWYVILELLRHDFYTGKAVETQVDLVATKLLMEVTESRRLKPRTWYRRDFVSYKFNNSYILLCIDKFVIWFYK